jgi:CRISPR-associated protein Cmr6
MPIAAVPDYLGNDFRTASPGLRFGMFLKLWGINLRSQQASWKTHDISYAIGGQDRQEREVKNENKVPALKEATRLNPDDEHLMAALAKKQRKVFSTTPSSSGLALEAFATSPFTTGLGNEHPLENGFAFLNPYGLPYLPGSGVKGVMRQAARELASGEWGESHGWNPAAITALFGREGQNGDTEHLRGALTFWDVIPQINGHALQVEIMTPHQSHYYQQNLDRKTGSSTTPHDSGQPIPISFLTVPPGSGFTFHVQCDLALLGRSAPELAENEQWKQLLATAFEHAFEWCGFGAKTAVGYGAMTTEAARKAEAEKVEARRAAEKEAEKARRQEQARANAETWESARIKFNRANGSLSVEKNGKTAIAVAPLGGTLLGTLPTDIRKKVETNQFVKVSARVAGSDLLEIVAP